jgi:hypothetical protein
MFRRCPRGLALAVSAALALTGRASADGLLHQPAPATPCPEVTVPGPACPTPKIELVMSQPEVRVVTAAGHGCGAGGVCKAGACGKAPTGKDCGKDCAKDKDCGSKGCSFLNFSITKIKGGAGRSGPTETTVVPAFATATIPIALQTTRTLTGVSESAFIGRRSVSREEVAAAVREALAVEREEAAARESARESATAAQDACAALKDRVTKVEQRLAEIEKTVKQIEEKITKK